MLVIPFNRGSKGLQSFIDSLATSDKPLAVVIGSGPNGLMAANLLELTHTVVVIEDRSFFKRPNILGLHPNAFIHSEDPEASQRLESIHRHLVETGYARSTEDATSSPPSTLLIKTRKFERGLAETAKDVEVQILMGNGKAVKNNGSYSIELKIGKGENAQFFTIPSPDLIVAANGIHSLEAKLLGGKIDFPSNLELKVNQYVQFASQPISPIPDPRDNEAFRRDSPWVQNGKETLLACRASSPERGMETYQITRLAPKEHSWSKEDDRNYRKGIKFLKSEDGYPEHYGQLDIGTPKDPPTYVTKQPITTYFGHASIAMDGNLLLYGDSAWTQPPTSNQTAVVTNNHILLPQLRNIAKTNRAIFDFKRDHPNQPLPPEYKAAAQLLPYQYTKTVYEIAWDAAQSSLLGWSRKYFTDLERKRLGPWFKVNDAVLNALHKTTVSPDNPNHRQKLHDAIGEQQKLSKDWEKEDTNKSGQRGVSPNNLKEARRSRSPNRNQQSTQLSAEKNVGNIPFPL